jgi:hypothetical protein
MKTESKLPEGVKLPKGILKSDLKYPKSYKQHVYGKDFEIWYTTGFGWCIPTLHIGRGRYGERTYATTLDGRPVRIGNGPHVKAQLKVYVRKSREKALEGLLQVKEKGAETSHSIRDGISTRRARTALRRQQWGY